VITAFGDTALLIDVEDDRAAHRLAARIESDPSAPPGIGEVVVGLRSVLVHVDPVVAYPGPDQDSDSMGLEAWLARLGSSVASAVPPLAAPSPLAPPAGAVPSPGSASLAQTGGTDGSRRLVEIPVTFDGPDLDEVAETIGATVEEVADLLTGVELRVAFLGFAPGFPYLVGLPEPLAGIERRASPRTQVPPSSVALAAGFAAVYPQRTPGGWQLLGRTDLSMFNPDKPPYALLRAGDSVRFTRADGASAPSASASGSDTDRSSGPQAQRTPLRASTPRFIEVVEPGTLTLMQDAGRRGVAAIGVPAAGPADPDGFRLANRLVGNADGAAALELTARGPTVRFSADGHIAVVGDVDLTLDDRSVAAGTVVPITAGQVLAVGAVRRALRSYLAIAGGLEGPSVLGSRSSDVLSGLGIGPLRAGDQVDLGAPGHPRGRLSPSGSDSSPQPRNLPSDGSDLPSDGSDPSSHDPDPSPHDPGPALRVVPGPHPAAESELQKLTRPGWTVDDHSNRVGLRLSAGSGPMAIEPPSIGVPSCGMVTGAIQIPPDGQPIVLMPDHATVGGYPVIATVVSADWGALGRMRPGDDVRFELVSAEEARSLRREHERRLDRRVSGWFPTDSGT
jgi:KipI family sensor histidine kinase inhibitor